MYKQQENGVFQNNVTSMSQQESFIEIWFEEGLMIIFLEYSAKKQAHGMPGDLRCRAYSMMIRYLTFTVSCQI